MSPRATVALACALACTVGAAPASAQGRRHRMTRAGDTPAASGGDPTRRSIDLALAVGETRTLPAIGVANYSEGTPGIVDVKLTSDASQFVVVGLKPGSTSLLLIGRDGSQTDVAVDVFAQSPAQVESELRQLVQGYTGLRVRRVGARFFIEGGVSTEADQKQIERIAKLYPGQVESLVEVGAGAADRGTNIRVDFFFVQYEKNSSYDVGVGWPTFVGGAAIQSTVGYDFIARAATAQANVVNQPLPALDIAATHGWAKVLKQATVITTNGVEAKVSNGGEQNFPVAAGLTGTIQKIAFGTNLTVLPRFDPQTDDLDIRVDADVSDLTPSTGGTSLPGRDTAALSTRVHMKLGQSLVLSGIHFASRMHAVDGLPLLSQIPVIGLLFGSHTDAQSESKGAVFIVPSVVTAGSKPAQASIDEAISQYEAFSGDTDGVHPYEGRPPANGIGRAP